MSTCVGCTGWSFADWYKNKFYDRKEEERFKGKGLNYHLWKYSKFFDCTEVNSFNYTISIVNPQSLTPVHPKALWWYKKQLGQAQNEHGFSMFERIAKMTFKWDASTPEGFVFSTKVPGMITHAKCLRDCSRETRLFIEGIGHVKKIKFLLFEFPSYFTKENSFDAFKDYFSKGSSDYSIVVEFRSKDWYNPQTFDFLKKKGITLALSQVDDPGVASFKGDDRTTDLTYVRIIGQHGVYESFDRMRESPQVKQQLQNWAELVQSSDKSFVFINNNFAGNAPETANYFKKIIGQKPREWASGLQHFF
ncbi:MAG: DUF72 domain-containing protein [Candidatus Woesearchaeota archaeon]